MKEQIRFNTVNEIFKTYIPNYEVEGEANQELTAKRLSRDLLKNFEQHLQEIPVFKTPKTKVSSTS